MMMIKKIIISFIEVFAQFPQRFKWVYGFENKGKSTPRTKRNDSEVFLERGDACLTDRFIFFSLRRIRRKH